MHEFQDVPRLFVDAKLKIHHQIYQGKQMIIT